MTRAIGQVKYDWDVHDPHIRRLYDPTTWRRGAIQAYSRRTGIPYSTLRHRALLLGYEPVTSAGYRSATWFQPEEDAIITQHLHRGSVFIAKQLAKAGYHRSESTVRGRVYRLRQRGLLGSADNILDDHDLTTTCRVAAMMGITYGKITQWIARGYLAATPQPHHGSKTRRMLIRRADLRRFLLENQAHWDHRTCDKYWLVDILVGDRTARIQHNAGVNDAGIPEMRIVA